MKLMLRTVAIALLLIALATTAAAQPPGPGPGGRGGQGPLLPGGRGGRFGGIPPRDNAQAPTGTARLSGRVIAADTGTPIRRAQININSRDAQFNRSVTTDSEGRYELAALPAGRYRLSVNKAGYRGPRVRPGAPIRGGQAARHHSWAGPRENRFQPASRQRHYRTHHRRVRRSAYRRAGAGAALSIPQRGACSSSTPGGRHRRTTLAHTAFSGSCLATTSSVRRRVRTCRRDRVARKQSKRVIPAPTIPASPTSARPRR